MEIKLSTVNHFSWSLVFSNRDGSRFLNIRFNYRISIRLCDLFSKGVPGLDKDCPMA